MTTPIFIDSILQKQFDRDGFVIIDNFITADEAALIGNFFNSTINEFPKGFYVSATNPSWPLKNKIWEFSENLLGDRVNSIFKDIKKLGGSFLTKAPGQDSFLSAHQDSMHVDESKYCTATIWTPIVDTTAENGAIFVLPGSHKFFNAIRSPSISVIFNDYRDLIFPEMICLPLKVGQAVIFNHALIHGSSPNLSTNPRIAIAYGITHKDADLVFYYQKSIGFIEKFKVPDDLYLKYPEPNKSPEIGEKLGEFEYVAPTTSKVEIRQLINKSKRLQQMKPIFKDAEKQAFFEQEGYVKLEVLNPQEISELLAFYNSLALTDETGFGFHVSMDNLDKGLVSKILDKIYEVALPKAREHFINAKPFVASFVVKESNPKGVVPVHQDWTFVEDEMQHCSVTCWIPLQDVTMENGALGVIRGSHQFFKNLRPSPSPQVPSPISEHMFTIFPYLKLIELKAGEALVFDNRTFHGSPPNHSGSPRVALGIGFTQGDAKLCHYYLKPGTIDKVLKYEIDSEFFLKYENKTLAGMYDRGELIEGYKMVGEEQYTLPKFTGDELVQLIKDNGNEFNVPMCEKLAALFDYNLDGTSKQQQQQVTEQESTKEQPELVMAGDDEWFDNRPFLIKYSPLNIAREIKHRLIGN